MQIQIKGKVLWSKQRDNPARRGEDEVNRVFKTRKIDRFIDTLPAITLSLISVILTPNNVSLQLSPPPLSLPEIRFAGSSCYRVILGRDARALARASPRIYALINPSPSPPLSLSLLERSTVTVTRDNAIYRSV